MLKNSEIIICIKALLPMIMIKSILYIIFSKENLKNEKVVYIALHF